MNGFDEENNLNLNTYTQNLKELEESFKSVFNQNINLAEAPVLKAISDAFLDREQKVWEALKQLHGSMSLLGLEGRALDEYYAQNRVFREKATKGSGYVIVETNLSSHDETQINAESVITAENGVKYKPDTTQFVSTNTSGFFIDPLDPNLALGSYNLRLVNNVNGRTVEQKNITLLSKKSTEVLNFLTQIKQTLDKVSDVQNAFIDNNKLYYGFDENLALIGNVESIGIYMGTSAFGNRFTKVSVVATEAGYRPLPPNSVSTLSNPPTGFESITNLSSFSPGQDHESDGAFRLRAEKSQSQLYGANSAAIIKALLQNVPDIKQVVLHRDVDKAYYYIIGGADYDIAKTLQLNLAPGVNTYGDVAIEVDTEDRSQGPEIIRFSRGVEQSLSLKIKYKTSGGLDLTEPEKLSITQEMVKQSDSWAMGETVFLTPLSAVVLSTLGTNKFIDLQVLAKKTQDTTDLFSSDNYQPQPFELNNLTGSDIVFERVL